MKNRPAVLTMEKMEKDRFLSCILLCKMTSADFLESHLKILIQIFVFLPPFHTLKSFVLPISVLLPNCWGFFIGIQQSRKRLQLPPHRHNKVMETYLLFLLNHIYKESVKFFYCWYRWKDTSEHSPYRNGAADDRLSGPSEASEYFC